MLDEFRVIHTDIPNIPGVSASVAATFGGEMVIVVQCNQEEIDPPHYQKLKQVVAQALIAQVEHRLEELEAERVRVTWQLKFLLETVGEKDPDKRIKVVAKAARELSQRKLKREEEAKGQEEGEE